MNRAMRRRCQTLTVLLALLSPVFNANSQELPPEARAMMLKQDVFDAVKAGRTSAALKALDDLRALGLPMAPPLLVLEANLANSAGDPDRAVLALEEYFKLATPQDGQYTDAARLMRTVQPKAKNLAGRRLMASFRMTSVPGGTFQMGDSVGTGDADEKPAHSVTVKAFRLARTEVTVGQFRQFVTATGYQTDAENNVGNPGCFVLDVQSGKAGWTADRNWRSPGFPLQDEQPVVCVSWNDARAFIEWLNGATDSGFRLPTEAEWEYAARAGSAAAFPWGSNPDDGCAVANGADLTPWPDGGSWSKKMNCTDGYFYPAPVGRFAPSAYGLHDMIGNVWEWTQDCWNDSYQGAPVDGSAWLTGDCSRRIIRGGSWIDDRTGLRVSDRYWHGSADRYFYLGFRLAQDL